MLIYLLRHGDALMNGYNDGKPPLSQEGKKSINRLADYIKSKEIRFTNIISSPLLRAWQTATIIAENSNDSHIIIESDSLLPECDPEKLLNELNNFSDDEKLLLVGHQPLLGATISTLISKRDALIEMKKASFACVDINKPISAGKGVLKFLVNPEMFV